MARATISTSVKIDTAKEIERAAQREGVSVSRYIRNMLEDSFETHRNGDSKDGRMHVRGN